MLVDYREVKIELGFSDAFNLVKKYETLPHFSTVIVACAFNDSGKRFAEYWKEIARARGFAVTIFSNIEEAEQWLKQRMDKK